MSARLITHKLLSLFMKDHVLVKVARVYDEVGKARPLDLCSRASFLLIVLVCSDGECIEGESEAFQE
jgi:hypothetical protein